MRMYAWCFQKHQAGKEGTMAVYERNGKWYSRFQISGIRKNYRCYGAKNEQEAKRIESGFMYKLQQQINGVIPMDKKKVKLKTLNENYLTHSRINKSTYNQDVGRIKIASEFFNENMDVNEIKRKDVEDFKDWLLSKGRGKKTINMYLGIYRKMFNLGIEDKLIEDNPFKHKLNFKLEDHSIDYLKTPEEQKRIEEASPDYFKPIITVALNSGLRRSNIINLRWENLDFNFNTIETTKNKSKKYIKIPMNNTLHELFKHLPKTSEYIFTNPATGRKWGQTRFNEVWRNIRDEAGLPELRFHGLRHTFCTRLIKEKTPAPVVQQLMFHTDLKTTLRYTHVDSDEKRAAVEKLNSYNNL